MTSFENGIEVQYRDRLYDFSILENASGQGDFRAILIPIKNEEYSSVWLPPDDEPIITTREKLLIYLENHGVTPKE